MVLALVLAFDARQTILGGLTREHPGLVIRALDNGDLLSSGKLLVEVRGGSVDLAKAFGFSLRVKIHPNAVTANAWTGWLEFEDPAQLEGLPVVRAIKEVRRKSDRLLVQYEGGAGTMRLDLKGQDEDPREILQDLRGHLQKNRIVASIRIEEFTGPLESWNPRRPILP